MNSYLFLLWDGLGFFGFGNYKLPRLKGIKPKWSDKLTNWQWLLFSFSIVLVSGVVIVSSMSTLGDVKTQVVNTEDKNKYELDSDKLKIGFSVMLVKHEVDALVRKDRRLDLRVEQMNQTQ